MATEKKNLWMVAYLDAEGYVAGWEMGAVFDTVGDAEGEARRLSERWGVPCKAIQTSSSEPPSAEAIRRANSLTTPHGPAYRSINDLDKAPDITA